MAIPHSPSFFSSQKISSVGVMRALALVGVLAGGVATAMTPALAQAPKTSAATGQGLTNMIGDIASVAAGEDKQKGTYVDVTLPAPLFAFEGAPLKTLEGPKNATELAAFLSSQALNTTVLVLATDDAAAFMPLKPLKVEALTKDILRLWVNKDVTPATAQDVLAFESDGTHARRAHLFLVNFATLPGGPNAETPIEKRSTYFIFAKDGIELRREGKDHKVTLKNVAHATVLSADATKKHIHPKDFARLIGKKAVPPFIPNGAFTFYGQKGPHPMVLTFDQANFDPKSHDLTFTVGFLNTPDELPQSHDVPLEFEGNTPALSKDPSIVFLDWSGGTRGSIHGAF